MTLSPRGHQTIKVTLLFERQGPAIATAIAQTLTPKFEKLETNLGKAKNTLVTEVALLKGVKGEVARTSQATNNLTKAVKSNAAQLAALSCMVKQLSGQLINEAKRNRQQQELLERSGRR